MIESIIDYLNAKLALIGYFDKRYCLTEIKSEGENTFPVCYSANGDWKKIEIDQHDGVTYWRKSGDVSSSKVENQYTTDILYETTFPMRLVAFKRRGDVGDDDNYTADRLVDVIKKQVTFVNETLKSTLKVRKVESIVTSSTTNSADVLADEFDPPFAPDVPFKWSAVSIEVDIMVVGTRDCMDACPTDNDILHGFDFCNQAIVDRLTPAQKTCLQTKICGEGEDATLDINGAPFTTIPSGDTYDLDVVNSDDDAVGVSSSGDWVIADSTVRNNATPTWSDTVKAEDTLTLAQAKMQDSDGSTVTADYIPTTDGFMFTASACSPVTSATVSVYSDAGLTTPITACDWGDTIYIKIVGNNLTPTAYRFVTVPTNGIEDFTEQVGQSLAYTVYSLGTLDIYGIATDASDAPSNPTKFSLTVNMDADALAFINAHNTATGEIMAITQQTAIFNFVSALKGTGTPNGSDLWTLFDAVDSEIYPYCPTSDTSASAYGYQVDLMNPSVSAVLNNFTADDLNVLGATSGSGKYLAMKRAPSDFGQDDLAVHVYSRTSSTSGIKMEIGSINSTTWSGIGVSLWPRWSSGIAMHCNSGYALTGTYSDGQGLLTVQRDNASSMEYYQDGVQIGTAALASSAPISQTFYGHATQLTTGVGYEGTNQLALLAATCSMTANERADWFYAVDQYQTQIITGGRNV